MESNTPFSQWKPSDFPPSKVRYFNPSVDFVAIMATEGEKTQNSKIRDISTLDEIRRVKKEIEITIRDMKETVYYTDIKDLLRNNSKFRCEIERVLGSHEHMNMVIYALGSLQFNCRSHYQLALALLLKQDFSDWIGEIEVYDPVFSPVDCGVFQEFRCNVLPVNEYGRRKVTRPTLFFLPHAYPCLRASLLEANWCPSQINQMVLLMDSFEAAREYKVQVPRGKTMYEVLREALSEYTREFEIETPWFMLHENSFQFFNVEPELDMDSLLPDYLTKEMRLEECRSFQQAKPRNYRFLSKKCEKTFAMVFRADYIDPWYEISSENRIPRRILCSWHPPSRGWIKLNFGGIGHDRDGSAGFGGVIRDEHKHRLVTYMGNLHEADTIVANVEAVRQGLRCLRYISPVERLVIEGDDLRVIRWICEGVEPPQRIIEALDEIFDMLEDNRVVIYHVYEEANTLAAKLAMEGSRMRNLRVWVSPTKNST
ncbi:SRR1-like domain [Dillenia turbinata]|uniref:SRR1-like domain n=1 Tax=Dillenia turbinata TaxID=194707 RepID=A0AAN8Z7T3_9MAGN